MNRNGRNLVCAIALATAASAQPVPERRNSGSQKYAGAAQGGSYMHNYYLPPAPSSTPWAPAWAPDGKSLAIGLYGSIWRVDVNTGVAAELTYNSRYHSMPAWSPDGRWLIYTADEEHKRIQLEAFNVATGQTTVLTDDPFVYMDPAFSPDGKSLAYVASKPGGSFHVYVRGIADGKWTGEEIPITRENRYPRNRLYVGQTDMHIEPAWMSGGKELLLVSNRGISLGSGGIWRVPVERYGMDKGKLILDEQTLYRTRPDLSIDGKRFIYSSTSGAADQYHHLYVLPAGGGYPYKMTFGDHEDFHPRWSPDGESIAYISNEGGLPQLVVMETYGGRKKTVNITALKWKRPMGTLSVKVADDKTGKPLYARIQGVAADGKFYAPRDAYSRVSSLGHVFHTAGTYTVSMPPGKFTLQVVHGFEYFPQDVELQVPPDKRIEVTVRLKRMTSLNVKGWYSGSTHVHMNYGGNLHNTLENLIMMSKAEGQDVVNELVANKDNRVMDWQYFISGGGEHPVSKGDPDIRVLVGEEYRPPFYGHVFMLGLRDHLISPFLTGYEATGVDSLYPSNTDMFRKALSQGAVTGYVHPFAGDRDPLAGLGAAEAKGLPVDAALGTAQCQEWSAASKAGLLVWHHLLNNDLRLTPTGGEDSISNLHDSKLVGSVRTYAYLGPEFSIPAWLNALRMGHTFFTNGPLTELKINGKIPGDEIKLPATGGSLSLQASVQSIAPLSKAVIYHNGQVWKELPLSADQKRATFTATVPVTASGWYALYAEGPKSAYLDVAYSQASTNAIRVYVGDQKIRNKASAEYFVKWIDQLHDLAEQWPFWRSQAEKDHVYAQFRQARAVYTDLQK